MFEEQTGTPIEQIVILVVTEDGVVQEFVKNKYDYIPLLVESIDNFTKDWEEENDKLDRAGQDYLSSMVDSYQKKYAYLSVNGGGCSGFTYKWDMVDNDENGTVIDDLLVLDQMTEMFVMGCTVDYVKELGGSYLKVINPNASTMWLW